MISISDQSIEHRGSLYIIGNMNIPWDWYKMCIYIYSWWFEPLWKMMEFVRLDHHPNYWGNGKSHVWNHQLDIYICQSVFSHGNMAIPWCFFVYSQPKKWIKMTIPHNPAGLPTLTPQPQPPNAGRWSSETSSSLNCLGNCEWNRLNHVKPQEN